MKSGLTSFCRRPVFLLALLLASSVSTNGDQFLVDPASYDLSRAVVADAAMRSTSANGVSVIEVRTGHQQQWPGLTLPAPQGQWDLSTNAEVSVLLKNPGTNPATVSCRIDNPGADGTHHCVTGSVKLAPGQSDTLKVRLNRTSEDKLDGKLFGMRGYPVVAGGPGTVDLRNVNQLLLFVSKPTENYVFQVVKIWASGQYTPPTAWVTDAEPFFPFINTFGQYRHKDWPGKVKSLEDLQARRQQESRDLDQQPGPSDWDKYGGWLNGPKRKATGFFRTEKVNGKWWLIDPDGGLFFSHGIDCVRMLDTTPVEERETWFEDFPGKQPEFAEFLTKGYALKGHYAGRAPQCFSFAAANLARKYGAGWKSDCPQVIHKRLRSWGINTVANWSDEKIRLMRLTPYTDAVSSGRTRMLEGSEGYWGKFPDVFDLSFGEAVRRSMASKKNTSAGDPWCIGYFSDNEMSWGDELSLALGALRSPREQKAKGVFIDELKRRYGEIQGLNQAWGTQHDSWEALSVSWEAPDQNKARADLEAFYSRFAEQYFHTVRDAIKEVAPNQLYLGCRFAWVNARAAAAAAKYCDVVSYNLYRRGVADFQFNGGADMPLIVGEFHFGALDRGMFHTGLVPVVNQQGRAQAYKEYVEGALRHPQFVGCHWFQYQDEPVTGRVYDEENYQIGFVDVADTPYAETIRASREIGYHLYR